MVYDYAYKFDDLVGVMMYFISFHMLLVLIILSLIKGIIWEVFMIVEQTSKENEELEELE